MKCKGNIFSLWKVPIHYPEYRNFSAGLLVCQELIPSQCNTEAGTVRQLGLVFSRVLPETPAIPMAVCDSVAHVHFVHVNAILAFIPTFRKDGSSMADCYVKIKPNRCSVVF